MIKQAAKTLYERVMGSSSVSKIGPDTPPTVQPAPEPVLLDDKLRSYIETARTLLEQGGVQDVHDLHDPSVLRDFVSRYYGKTPKEIAYELERPPITLQILAWASIRDTDISKFDLLEILLYKGPDVILTDVVKKLTQPRYLRELSSNDLVHVSRYANPRQRNIFLDELLGREDVSVGELEMTGSDPETNRKLCLKAADQLVKAATSRNGYGFTNGVNHLVGMVTRYLSHDLLEKSRRNLNSDYEERKSMEFGIEVAASLRDITYKLLSTEKK